MGDEVIIKKGLFYDDKGNFSSGRVVKLGSAIMAIASSIMGAVTLVRQPDNIIMADYCFKLTGLFIASATGAEIVQKTTGR